MTHGHKARGIFNQISRLSCSCMILYGSKVFLHNRQNKLWLPFLRVEILGNKINDNYAIRCPDKNDEIVKAKVEHDFRFHDDPKMDFKKNWSH